MTAPTTSDPFAAVQVPGATKSGQDPFTPATEVDDPFVKSSDLRGDFIPSPTIETLAGRLVVMIPRKLDPAAKDPNNPGETREVYTVDLTVLDGGPLTYDYKSKGDPEKGTPDEWKTWDAGNVTPENPFTIEGYWVPQGGLIGRLKKAHQAGAPFLGVPAMIPTKPQRDKGVTSAQVRTEYAQWVERGKPGARPKYSWALDDPTPEQRAAAVAWWGRVRGTIAPITPA